jgi:oxaloacetate decarboxylase alpha subunit
LSEASDGHEAVLSDEAEVSPARSDVDEQSEGHGDEGGAEEYDDPGEHDKGIRSLVEVLEETGLGELTVEENGTRITLRQQSQVQHVVAAPVATDAPEAAAAPTGTQITSPMVGTFYRCAAPGEPAFVEVGTTVAVGQVLCILEAMKLFNEFKAETAGTIKKILVEDASAVEYGQPLFEIDPSGA